MSKKRRRVNVTPTNTKKAVSPPKRPRNNLTLNKSLVILDVILCLVLLIQTFDQGSDGVLAAIVIATTMIGYFYRSRINDFLQGKEFGKSLVTISLVLALLAILGLLLGSLYPAPVIITESVPQADLRIVIAQFTQTSGTAYEPEIDMIDVLSRVAAQIGSINIIHYGRTIESDSEALEILSSLNAAMVVYGRVAPGGVTAHYNISHQFEERVAEVAANVRVAQNEVQNFEVFLYDGMDINYVVGLLSGQLAYLNGDYAKALSSFSLAKDSLDLSRAEEVGAQVLYTYLGHTFDALGMYSDAIVSYDQALTVAETCQYCIHSRRAYSYLRLADYEAALEASNDSIIAAPRLSDPLITRSNVFFERGTTRLREGEYSLALVDFQLAIADVTEAIEFAHDSSVTNYNLSRAYYQKAVANTFLDDHDLAIDDLTQSIQIDPTYPDAHFTLAELLYFSGEYADSLHHYQRALEFGRDQLAFPIERVVSRINELQEKLGNN